MLCVSAGKVGLGNVGVGVITEGIVDASMFGVAGVEEGVGCEESIPGFELSSDLSSVPSTTIRAFFSKINLLRMTRLSISGWEYYAFHWLSTDYREG